MRTALLLGLRLSVGTGGQQARTLATGLASAVGTLVVLLVCGIAISSLANTTQFQYNPGVAPLLMSGTIAMVALPVVVLIATISRLSAGVRDRRLANLRLLGLTVGQTRLVAVVEVGFASLLGSALGAMTAAALAPAGTWILHSTGNSAGASLAPPALAWVVVPMSICGVAVVAAALPQRLASARALSHSRQRDAGAVRLVRAAPLLLGFLLCLSVRTPLMERSPALHRGEIVVIVVGIALLGIGMVLVIPVFMSLIANVMLRLGRGPLATLVGRRLQTQPAGATRVVAALMVGLFLVVAARGVLGAFVSTPQYLSASHFVEQAQTAEVTASAQDLRKTLDDLGAIEGVRELAWFPVLRGHPPGKTGPMHNVTVVVASCASLAFAHGELRGCSDKAPNLVADPWPRRPDPVRIEVRPLDHASGGPALDIDLRRATVIDADVDTLDLQTAVPDARVVLPPGTPGIQELLLTTDRRVVVLAGPGRYLYDRVSDAGYQNGSAVELENYDFVQGVLTLVWTLAAVIITIGLATFTVVGVDRAIGRRRELTALRLVGTPHGLLRRAQWLEAALPTVLGSWVAIAAGAYAGGTYLQQDVSVDVSMTSTISLALIAGATSMLLAAVTTLGTAAKLDPDHIRSE